MPRSDLDSLTIDQCRQIEEMHAAGISAWAISKSLGVAQRAVEAVIRGARPVDGERAA